ncbi:hypothetical protein [Candidatus Rickettsia colombianensi]|uniref:hypothetical protein n=1 Tax=Candidatus Rickettsia colombianensi TaxID=1090944 RepID=UPI0015AAA7DA|nr:hypothetical protein [Candidatus Rickettsia colombianensi]
MQVEAEEILDFFRTTKDAQKLYDEFIKYKDKYYPEQLNTKAIRELNGKMIDALSHLGVVSINKNSLITQQEISVLIREKRLDTIKGYLKDVDRSTRINNNITEDKLQDLFNDSVLEEHIQSSIGIINRSDIERGDGDDTVHDPDFNEMNPNDFDRTDETYRSFVKDIKSLQSRYDNVRKQDVSAINKALWTLASSTKQRDRILEELKEYRTDKLKINLSITKENNKLKVQVNKLDRIVGGNENNHVIPVSIFLKSLKYSLGNREFDNIEEIFNKLCYLYGRDYEKNIIFKFLKDEISKASSNTSNAELRLLLEDSIIPFIYSHWNERAEATYKLAKTHKSFGEEGHQIKEFNTKLEDIYKSSHKSFRNFKSTITKIAQNYFKVLDIENNNISNEKFDAIVCDAIEMLRIWLRLFEQSDNEALSFFTQEEYEYEYRTWKKEYLTKKEFGIKLIEAQKLSKVQKDKWKKDWEEYVLQHPDILVDERSSEGVSSLNSAISNLDPRLLSPGRSDSDSIDTDQILAELYDKENIEKILSNEISNNLVDVDIVEYEDDLDEKQKTQRIERLKQEQQTKLINQLKHDLFTLQSLQITKKFYVMGLKSDSGKITSSSIIAVENDEIKILPLTNYEYSTQFLSILNREELFNNVDINIAYSKKKCGPLISQEELEISKFVEVVKLRIQQIDREVSAIQEEINAILERSVQNLETQHRIIIEGGSSDRNMESEQEGSRVSIGEKAGTSGTLKRKDLDGGNSPLKKVRFKLENLKEQKDNIGLQPSGSSCSSKKRLKRDLCQEEESKEIFPYDPLEENVVDATKINARLYANIACLFSLEANEGDRSPIKLEHVLTYNKHIGDIISEGELNYSLREKDLLKDHYQKAQEFLTKYPRDELLELVGSEVDFSRRAWLFDNGKQSLLASYDGNRYHIYSQDLNYRKSFQTKEGISFTDIELYAEAFFKLYSNSIEYDLFTLKQNMPVEIINEIKQAKFWNPDQVVSDLTLLYRKHFGLIESLPAEIVRELFFINNHSPDVTLLDTNFFRLNNDKLTFRANMLHKILPSLTQQQIQVLGEVIKKYNILVDTLCLDLVPESNKHILQDYNNKVLKSIKSSEISDIRDLSNLSFEILRNEFEDGHAGDISYKDIIPQEIREKSLEHFKQLHTESYNKLHVLKAVSTQAFFLLPDIISSVNTGNIENLSKTIGMIGGDMLLNHTLLSKMPINSIIFKIVTFYSISELHKKLSTLAPDSIEASNIRHHLGEQYFTCGLMLAEMFGIETGPLWIGLMAEQMFYGAIALRNQYHLPDTSLWEAFLINLGFDQDLLPIIFQERDLRNIQLQLLEKFNLPAAWLLLHLPDITDVQWQKIEENYVPQEVKNYIANHNSICTRVYNPLDVYRGGSSNFGETCEYGGFRLNSVYSLRYDYETWYQKIFNVVPKNRNITFVPTKVHQEHNIFESTIKLSNSCIHASDGGTVTTQYERVASTTIKNDNDPDIYLAQSARIEGGMSAIYRNDTIWDKCSGDGVFGPCSVTSAIWFNGPYRHNMIMLFDPKVHGDTNLNFNFEGLNHLDKNHLQYVNNSYYQNADHYKYFAHLKPNIPDHYSLTILLHNTDYFSPMRLMIKHSHKATFKIATHNTKIQTNYIVNSNTIGKLTPFEISDYTHNTSIILTHLNITVGRKLSGQSLGTGGFDILFDSIGRMIIPNYKDFLTIFIMQPSGWYIGKLVLHGRHISILNAEGQSDDALGKIVLNNTSVFNVQLINNIRVIDTDANMKFIMARCIDNTHAITYSKISNKQFHITDNAQPLELDKILYSLHHVPNKELLTIKFSDKCDYTLAFYGNKIISMTGTVSNDTAFIEIIAHNNKLQKYILYNNKIVEYLHYLTSATIASNLFLINFSFFQHKYFNDALLLVNGITFTFGVKYSDGNTIIKHHFITNTPIINGITYLIKKGVLCAKVGHRHSISDEDFIWHKGTIADDKKCLEFSRDIQEVSIANNTLTLNGVSITDIPKQIGISSLEGSIIPLSMFRNLLRMPLIEKGNSHLQHSTQEIQEGEALLIHNAASSLSSPINNIFYLLKEAGYALLSTIVKPFYLHNAYSPNNQTQQGKGPEGYDDKIYYDAQESLAEAAVKKVPVVIEELMDDEYYGALESLPQVIKAITSNIKEKIGKTISANYPTTELQVTSDIVCKSMLVNDKTGNYSYYIITCDSDKSSSKLLLTHEKGSNIQVMQDLEWCGSLMFADVITRSITGEKYKQTIPLSPMQERAIEIYQIEQKVYEGLQKMTALFGGDNSENQGVQDIEQPCSLEDIDDGHDMYLNGEQSLQDIRYLF